MRSTQLICSRFQLPGVVRVNPLYFPGTAEPFESFACFLVGLILDRPDAIRPEYKSLMLTAFLYAPHTVFLAFLCGDKMVCGYDFTPLFGLALIGSSEVPLLCHLALAAIFAIFVEGLMS